MYIGYWTLNNYYYYYVGEVEEIICVGVLQREHSGDGCDLASTLCKYDMRKEDLFVLSWARVR